MKTFIAACILLLTLGLGVAINAGVLLHRTDTLEAHVQALENTDLPSRETKAKEFREEWERSKTLYILSVNQNDLEKIEDALVRLEAATKIESDSEYGIAVAQLKEGLRHVRQLIGFSTEGLF